MTRKLVRRLVLGAAMSAGVLLIAYATLQLPFVRAALLERARAYTLRELGVVVDASSLHYGLLSRSIELRGVRFAAAAGEPPFLQAEVVRVVLDRSLFRGTRRYRQTGSGRSAGDGRSSCERDHQSAFGTLHLQRRAAAGSRHGHTERADDRACR